MARVKQHFTEGDITRAIRGARAGGIANPRVRIALDGSITVEAGAPPMPAEDEAEKWIRENS
jgi:hypothetical protein